MKISQKITLNTGLMYVKTVLTIGITLYSTRIILNELGASDFGIFNIVAGVIAMLSFLTTAMSLSTRRFLSTAIGQNDIECLAVVFRTSVKIHVVYGFIFVIFFELISLFLFKSFLNIPEDRLYAAYFVFQCMLISSFFSIVSIPYNAAINSHEDIFVMSIIYTIEAIIKLGIAIYLQYTIFDKLIVYGILLATTYTLTTFIQKSFCKRHYVETHIKKESDKKLTRKLISFSCWTSFSNVAKVLVSQGSILILNIFGGTIVNAAYGIAMQVNGQMSYFSAALLQAMEPQIMKSKGALDDVRMKRLSISACKLSFFLISFFSIPIMIRMPFVLELWLKNNPDYTIVFCKVILLSTMCAQITMGLQSAIFANGNIRLYQLITGLMQIMVLPLSYILLKNGYPIYFAVLTILVVELVLSMTRIFLAKKILNIGVSYFLRQVVFRSLLSCAITYFMTYLVNIRVPDSLLGFISLCTFSFILYFMLFYKIVLNSQEKISVKNIVNSLKLKIKSFL